MKNSRREATKRIVCPQCKKALAIDFREEQDFETVQKPIESFYLGDKPIDLHEGINRLKLSDSENLEIDVLRISDGSCKCIVNGQSAGQPVTVNGTRLESDEKVVLSIGDELQIGRTILCYGQKGRSAIQKPTPQKEVKENVSTKIPIHHKKRSWWPLALLTLTVCFLLTVFLWPTEKDAAAEQVTETNDSIAVVEDIQSEHVKKQPEKTQPAPTMQPQNNKKTSEMSDYDLERMAMTGDTDAQYEIGKRWVNKHDSINLVKGIKYLKLATQNGSSEAKAALRKVATALERESENGNTTAANILQENM